MSSNALNIAINRVNSVSFGPTLTLRRYSCALSLVIPHAKNSSRLAKTLLSRVYHDFSSSVSSAPDLTRWLKCATTSLRSSFKSPTNFDIFGVLRPSLCATTNDEETACSASCKTTSEVFPARFSPNCGERRYTSTVFLPILVSTAP